MAGRTSVLIDGEGLDATLGTALLRHAPKPRNRPRWEPVLEFAPGLGMQDVIGLFLINPNGGDTSLPFVAAIQNAGYRAVLLAGTGPGKVVDVGIPRTLEALFAPATDTCSSAPRPGISPRRSTPTTEPP